VEGRGGPGVTSTTLAINPGTGVIGTGGAGPNGLHGAGVVGVGGVTSNPPGFGDVGFDSAGVFGQGGDVIVPPEPVGVLVGPLPFPGIGVVGKSGNVGARSKDGELTLGKPGTGAAGVVGIARGDASVPNPFEFGDAGVYGTSGFGRGGVFSSTNTTIGKKINPYAQLRLIPAPFNSATQTPADLPGSGLVGDIFVRMEVDHNLKFFVAIYLCMTSGTNPGSPAMWSPFQISPLSIPGTLFL
jgi:hypothetical protein